MARYVCPNCERDDRIVELHEVLVDYPVTEWNEDGEPADYGEGEVCWDSVERIDRDENMLFRCTGCDYEFDEPMRVEEPQEVEDGA